MYGDGELGVIGVRKTASVFVGVFVSVYADLCFFSG